jgi:hypothetical protein
MPTRDLYEAGTICRNPVCDYIDEKMYSHDEPCRFLFVREIGNPTRAEYWYETVGRAAKERFYVLEPFEAWY